MASVVSICNLALSNLGKDNISSIDDAGAEARACRQFYEHTRDTILSVYPWRFAGKTQALAEMTNDKPGAWGYSYKRPIDCLKVRWLHVEYSLNDALPQDDAWNIGIQYDIEGERVYCGLTPAFMRYTSKLIDPTKFPPLFIDALSAALTVRLAMPLTRDQKVRTDAYQFAQAARLQAEMADANEVRENSDIASDFLEIRREVSDVRVRRSDV